MKLCSMCGNKVQDNYNSCPYCGNQNLVVQQPVMNQAPVQPVYNQQPYQGIPQQQYFGQTYYQQPYAVQPVQQQGSFGWAALGFFIPIVGWVLWGIWQNTRPGDAKMAGIGGIVGFAINLCITVFM